MTINQRALTSLRTSGKQFLSSLKLMLLLWNLRASSSSALRTKAEEELEV